MGLFQNQGSLGVSFLAFSTTKESNLFFLVTKFQFFPLKILSMVLIPSTKYVISDKLKNSTKQRGFWSKMFPSLPKCSLAVPAVPARVLRSGCFLKRGNPILKTFKTLSS